MNYLKISMGIFLVLAASRFIPHPPNFTSLLALSFYVPTMLGLSYLPVVIISFLITDLFIGFHQVTLFTWGSVLIIGLTTKYFKNYFLSRLIGAQFGCLIFFILTNFGVWILGGYEYSFSGLIACYTLAIPFYINSIIGCLLFSLIIECLLKIFSKQIKSSHLYKIETN